MTGSGFMPQGSSEQGGGVFRQFPSSFWVANLLEIFERMAWYGFYAVSSLYLTGARETGGLGLTSADRGVIQGIVTFLLYLFPAVFGALADRYGFKRMFMASFVVMAPAYLLLQFADGFWPFMLIYTLVAIGHGMFKPVVIATVAKSTTEKTGSMGFGIFYMMVNIGGFLGPIVAGVVRGWGWNYVFYASAIWSAVNLLWCGLFYREPSRAAAQDENRTMVGVLRGMVTVVGNYRFFTFIAGSLVLLVMGSRWIPIRQVMLYWLLWAGLNAIPDLILRGAGRAGAGKPFLRRPVMVAGDARYMFFLLLMAGFWTSFNQLFITLPEYIRDYTDTGDIVRSLAFLGFPQDTTNPVWFDLGKIKPEYLINLNAFGIICFQVVVSWFLRKVKPFQTIVSGILVTAVSFLVFFKGLAGWYVVAAILTFSLGEMMCSPKSKEYAGRIAPPDKVGMYMGYFYWCVALGNLFGGLLSGVAYQHFGPQGVDSPNLMWGLFAALALITAVALVVYNYLIGGEHTSSNRG
jgi:dipeptide/tripeptide permease